MHEPDEVAIAWSERAGLRGLSIRSGRILAVAAALVMLVLSQLDFSQGLRVATFDLWQRLFPRERASAPAVIVAIDEASLAAHGQWPWPRTLLAALVDRVAAGRPAAIGVDVLFAEPDRLSPEQLAPSLAGADAALAQRLANLPAHDEQLARAVGAAPVVLAVAGIPESDAPASAASTTPVLVRGPEPVTVESHPALLRSIRNIDAAARGHGLISAEPSGRVMRRAPLVARAAGTLMPAFSIELLRVAAGLPAVGLTTGNRGVTAVTLGDLTIPTDRDGAVWIHFAPRSAQRFVSAADVLAGKVAADAFDRKLVIVGLTALGLLDFHVIPTGDRVPGAEIHAQLLEGIFDRDLLLRPAWLPWVEALTLAGFAALAVVGVGAGRWRPRTSLNAGIGAAVLLVLIAAMLMRSGGLLLDVTWPLLGGAVAFAVMLMATLAESDRQRRVLRRALNEERIATARSAGEQEAARRVQMGMLPPPDGRTLADPRVAIAALAEPARSVGGDLYDYFLLDENRLFFMVGDVAGKGLPAALFMSVAKALLKGAALRGANPLDAIIDEAHGELARDNAGQLFITLFAGILDLDSGALEWCNAGHEPALLLARDGSAPRPLYGASGPPLCVIESFPYEVNRDSLAPQDRLCIVTDGVTEAHGAGDELLGRERLSLSLAAAGAGAAGVRDAIRALLTAHGGAREPADDATVLVIEWRGPGAAAAPAGDAATAP